MLNVLNKQKRYQIMSQKLTALVLSSSLILIMLTGCAMNSPADDYCLIYEPVYVSNEDTAETVTQVMRNNAVWKELCQK